MKSLRVESKRHHHEKVSSSLHVPAAEITDNAETLCGLYVSMNDRRKSTWRTLCLTDFCRFCRNYINIYLGLMFITLWAAAWCFYICTNRGKQKQRLHYFSFPLHSRYRTEIFKQTGKACSVNSYLNVLTKGNVKTRSSDYMRGQIDAAIERMDAWDHIVAVSSLIWQMIKATGVKQL